MKLQRKNKDFLNSVINIIAFQMNLNLFTPPLENENMSHFSCLKEETATLLMWGRCTNRPTSQQDTKTGFQLKLYFDI